jgi:hypothetical protein
MAFAVSPTARHPLDPTKAGSASRRLLRLHSRCRPRDRSAPLRTRPLDHARGHHYQGPRRLPGPDSHRLAIVNLSFLRHVDLLSLTTPEQSRRTATLRKPRLSASECRVGPIVSSGTVAWSVSAHYGLTHPRRSARRRSEQGLVLVVLEATGCQHHCMMGRAVGRHAAHFYPFYRRRDWRRPKEFRDMVHVRSCPRSLLAS